MTNEQHPITPPTHLVEQWRAAASNIPASSCSDPGGRSDYINYIATQAARWGADQELEACCKRIAQEGFIANPVRLRAARRPKPPSLKEQALAALERRKYIMDVEDLDLLRRALEAL
tara:strand:- start:2140 stop:2490 length:351 start_codon:yes stop_codon:yes gene_type:complete